MRKIPNPPKPEEDVPLYRSYGVKRKKHPTAEKIGTGAATAVLLWILAISTLAFALAVFTFLMYGELLIVTLVYLLTGILLGLRLTRTLRKRQTFMRGLKKLCRERGYTLEPKRSPYASLKGTDPKTDLLLNTKSTLYEIRFLTVRHYRSALFFDSAEEIRLVKYPLQNPFTLILGFKPRTILLKTEQTPPARRGTREALPVLLVNPVCREMFYKDKDGTLVATGNGAELYGYTVHTAGGFLEAVKRRDEEAKEITEEGIRH